MFLLCNSYTACGEISCKICTISTTITSLKVAVCLIYTDQPACFREVTDETVVQQNVSLQLWLYSTGSVVAVSLTPPPATAQRGES